MSIKMTPEEIINYCHNGTLDNVSANQLIAVVEFYEDKLAELGDPEKDYDSGYDAGYEEAVNEMQNKLSSM